MKLVHELPFDMDFGGLKFYEVEGKEIEKEPEKRLVFSCHVLGSSMHEAIEKAKEYLLAEHPDADIDEFCFRAEADQLIV